MSTKRKTEKKFVLPTHVINLVVNLPGNLIKLRAVSERYE